MFNIDFTSDGQHIKSLVISKTISFIIYIIIYKILRKKVNVSPEYEIRLLTFFHGLFCSICGFHYVILPALGFYEVKSIPFQLILSNSFGYFLLDLFWCFKHGETGVMKFHHIVTVTGLIYFTFKPAQHYYILFALGITEVTNPLLQVRWFLKYHEMRDSLVFKIIEGSFIIAFFFIRIFVCTYYAYISWTDSKYNFGGDDLFFITLGLIVGYSLSYQMFGYIMYQFKKSKTQKIDKYE